MRGLVRPIVASCFGLAATWACSSFSSSDATGLEQDAAADAPPEAAADADGADGAPAFGDPVLLGADDAGIPVASCALGPEAVFLAYASTAGAPGLRRVERDGGAISQLETEDAGVFDVATDGLRIYYTDTNCTGGLFTSTGEPGAPLLGGTEIYCVLVRVTLAGEDVFVASLGGFRAVYKVPKASLAPTEIARSPVLDGFTGAIASDDTSVFVALPTAITKIEAHEDAGGTAVPFVDAGAAVDLAYDPRADVLFWATESTVGATANPTGATTILGPSTHAARIAFDRDAVYWADRVAGRVWRVPRSGGAPVARDAHGDPVAVAVDDGGLYWCNANGAVWTIAR